MEVQHLYSFKVQGGSKHFVLYKQFSVFLFTCNSILILMPLAYKTDCRMTCNLYHIVECQVLPMITWSTCSILVHLWAKVLTWASVCGLGRWFSLEIPLPWHETMYLFINDVKVTPYLLSNASALALSSS